MRRPSLARDDTLIPEPSYFARQLRWARQGQEAWSWNQVCDRAVQEYWRNRPRRTTTTEDVAA